VRLKSKQIAKILNISPSAVSLALNNKPGVSEETRLKVNAVVEKYYAKKKSISGSGNTADIKGTVLLIVHKSSIQFVMPTLFFQRAIDAVQIDAIENGYNLEISYYNHNMNRQTFIEDLNSERISGILLFATEMSDEDLSLYAGIDKPLVIMDARFASENLDMVTLNNFGGMEQAVEYAHSMGHRKIGYLRSSRPIKNFQDRFTGYIEGLERIGLKYYERYVFALDCTIEGAHGDFTQILDSGQAELPTIFLSDFDCIAAGALRALKTNGYSIPEDISIIGFDNMEFSAELEPALTTFDTGNGIGSIALKRLIEKINREDSDYLNIEIASRLIVRNSVKKIERS